ncbi:transport system permease protein [Pyrolobus fumarii 1A]|uniref:Transport system permease protein n=1 Tax=Pyrolobus fumarii (strain DSM 11204 / 1A) TaxID=694429 RepID=G0EG46_PYRF1|nr:iron ABC transporter permease [Pyrolobus fumarii]AEM38294.1 transport system permease protein [Pyrolobus fumarii 1A]
MAYAARSEAVALYERLVARRRLALAASGATLLILFLLDVSLGPTLIPPGELVTALFRPESVEPTVAVIVWDVRLPVALAAVLAGASLGAAGIVMQVILDNPLASPYTLGVAAGAAFGAALGYVMGLQLVPLLGEYMVTVNAFTVALAVCLLVYTLGRLRGFTAEALVLAGIAVSYAFHSGLALLEYMASEEALQAIVFWLFGSLYKATWGKLALLAAVLAASLALLTPRAWRLTALRLGDETARSMGVDPRRERLVAFTTASLLTATCVSFFGVIGFVGLVAPHTARLMAGEDQRYTLPLAALHGAIIMSAASTLSKVIVPGAVLPIGIVTSLIGIPFLLSLMARGGRR